MKYSEIMLTNKVEYPFEVMMLKTLIDLARMDNQQIDMEGVDISKVQKVKDCNIINTLDFNNLTNSTFEPNQKMRPYPYCSVKQMGDAIFELDEDGYNMRTSQNLFNQGMTLAVQKYIASAMVYLIYSKYKEVGKSPFSNPSFKINFVIDSDDFAESKIEELSYMVSYSTLWHNRMNVVVEDRPYLTQKLKKLMRSTFYVRNRVSNIVKNKVARLKNIPVGIPMMLATFSGKTDFTFKEEQICIYQGYDSKKQSIILDKFPIHFNTRASTEYALDVEGIENSDLRAEVGKIYKPRREYFSIYSMGILSAYLDEERILIPLPISETVPLITYGEDTYYKVCDKDNAVPYGEFIQYVLKDHKVDYNKEGFNHYYFSEGCSDLWI